MRRFPIVLSTLFLVIIVCLDGQGYPERKKKISAGWEVKEAKAHKSAEPTIPMPVRMAVRVKDDTVYALSSLKKNLWLTPYTVISEKEAINKPMVLRFTNKNKAGNYQSLEVLGRGLKPNNAGFSMTLSELLSDSIINSNSVLKSFSSAYRSDVVSDFSGEHILQERLFDIDNRLLGYITFNYDRNYTKVTEHYFGPDGLPVRVAESSLYPDGLQLNVVFDRNGNDSLLYLTATDNVIPNLYGSYFYQYLNTSNKKGEKIRILRCLDKNFSPMIDDYGSCGWIKVLDRNMNDSIVSFIDENYNVMALPETTRKKKLVNVAIRKYRYNDDTQMTDLEYYGLHGEPVQNLQGTHKILAAYDSHGNEILRKGLDLQGNLAPFDYNEVAMQTAKWNSEGKLIEFHQFDRYGNPISNNGNYSSCYAEYDPQSNRVVYEVGYVYDATTAKEILDFRNVYTPTVDSILFSDRSQKIVRYDSLRRIVSIRFYDADGNPNEKTYCAVDSTVYHFGDGFNKVVNTEYRADGSVKSINIVNSIKNTKNEFTFDEHGDVISSSKAQYYKDTQLFDLINCNVFGVPCRAASNNGLRFFQASSIRTFDGSWTGFNVIDEFREPDYLIDSDGLIYSISGKNKARYVNGVYWNEYGDVISKDDFASLRDSLPKLMSVEVFDSIAYRLGLKDNDVILQYGGYKADIVSPLSEDDFKVQWTVRSVLDAQDVKDMVVFRVEDAEGGKYGLVTIPSLQGTPFQLGFIPHIRYLTQRQRDRILASMVDVDFDPKVAEEFPYDGHKAVIGFNEMYRSMRHLPYQSKVKDASILLGAVDVEGRCSYSGLDDGEDKEVLSDIVDTYEKNQISTFPQPLFYFSTDGKNSISLEDCGYLIKCFLSDSDYDKIKALYAQTGSEIKRQFDDHKPIDRNKLAGYWIVQPQDSDSFNPGGYLYLDKKGTMYGEITYAAIVPSEKTEEKAGSPVFKVTKPLKGKYIVGETVLKLIPDERSAPVYKCISVLDAKRNEDALSDYFTRDATKFPSWYEGRMDRIYDVSTDALVKSLDKHKLILSDSEGNEVHFVKAKGKPLKDIK